ncbi:MAG: hypothetical protein WCP83_09285 [Actinomycetota bacterium]
MKKQKSKSIAGKMKKFRVVFVAFSLLSLGIFQSVAHAANVIWLEVFSDTDSDYGTSYYADIDTVGLGITDADPDTMVALIKPYFGTSLSMFTYGGNGGLFFDTNQDSVRDIWVYAPNATMSAYTKSTREIYQGTSGNLIGTGCYSSWYLSSDYTYYDVLIPWRCLGAPTSLSVEAWLSNSYGYDYLTGGRTVYPVLPPAITTTTSTTSTTTLPPPTTTVYIPPTTVYVAPPSTLPLAAAISVTAPGLVDDWVSYLIVKKSVSITAVLNSTNCCYGVKSGTRVMTVLPKSASFCMVRARRLYALKKGSCSVKVTAGSGKQAKSETVKFPVKLRS